jgi:crotonobetainyl-CoA:carnitine CoA-transferase CaiB-like acyl-CoA transferase
MRPDVGHNSYLEDIRIIDLADEKAAFCTKLLADLGARVIKVEKPSGDASREMGPFFRAKNSSHHSLSFFYNNTNKHSIKMNLDHTEDRSKFVDLIKKTDVLVESLPPGYLKDIGLAYDNLSQINPRLIYVSVSGFGQSEPRRDYKSCDLVAAAYGGQMYVNGSPLREPLKSFGDQSYYTASLFATTGILLALRSRDQTGKGDHIDISLQESVTATLEHVMIRYFAERVVYRRQESLHWNDEFVVLPCRDGFMNVTLLQHWETLIEWIDTEGMAEDLKDDVWRDERYRRTHRNHIVEVVGNWMSTHSVDDLFQKAQLMRFPWSPVRSLNEVLECPQHKARNFFIEKKHPELGVTLKYPGVPFITSSKG